MDAVLQNISDILMTWWLNFIERLPQLVGGVLVFLVSLYVARLVTRLVVRTMRHRKADPEITLLLSRLSSWTVIAVGIVLALQQAGQNVSALLTGLGILGVTIGFALQDVSKNFVAGLLLLLQQPFDIGDAIEVTGYSGTVLNIDLRDTEMLTFDGRRVTIPNGDVFTNPIINFSRTERRRIALQVGVAYDSDLEQVRQVAEKTIAAIPGVLDDPAPSVIFETFGDSAINLTIYYWLDTDKTGYGDAQSAGVMGIKRAFEAAGIVMPFPTQMVIRQE